MGSVENAGIFEKVTILLYTYTHFARKNAMIMGSEGFPCLVRDGFHDDV